MQVLSRRWPTALLSMVLVLTFSAPCLANPALAGYQPYEDYAAELEKIAASERAMLTSLAKTNEDRDVWLLTLSDGDPTSKPAILLVGSVEASHLLGSELATRIAKRLLDEKPEEGKASLLERYSFYIIPRPNPDGTERNFSKPWTEHDGDATSTDDDRDFLTDEDPAEDLNGDGWITMMRVEDASGDYMPHPDEPRVMIKADAKKNERGQYRLLPEGRDNDQDDDFNEDGPGGVDFNRNFTHRYPYFQPGAGPHAVSEAETRAVADFAFDHPNIALVFSFSPHDNLFHPWKPDSKSNAGRIKTHVLDADAGYLNFLAEKYRKTHGGKDPPGYEKGEGAFSEWAYFHYGRWSLSTRGWWVPRIEPKEEQKSAEKRGSDELNQLRWLEQEELPFVEWKEIEHPDFPGKKVEVGGFPPFYFKNPPAKELDVLADKHVEYLRELADLMPQLELETEVEDIGGGLFRVTATVRNIGYLPTFAKMGEISQQIYPPQLSIHLPDDAKLMHGSTRTALPIIEGGGGEKKHTWLIRQGGAATAAKVTVSAPAVGRAEKEIELK